MFILQLISLPMSELYQNLVDKAKGKGYVKMEVKDQQMLNQIKELDEENKIVSANQPQIGQIAYLLIRKE